jgi:hypothetical protein
MGFLHATATATPRGSRGQFIKSSVTPAVRAGVVAYTQVLFDETQQRVPVRSGELKASGKMVITETEKTVTGHVIYTADHALPIEFGWGSKGAEGPFAGPYNYNTGIGGYIGTGFMRSSLDTTREAGFSLFRGAVSGEMKL